MSKSSLRVAIYARVSTHEQEVDSQLRDLREYGRARKYTDMQEFVDVGVSGSKESRPEWNRLWDQIQKRRFDVVLVHALDRLGRSLPHLVRIIEAFRSHGIVLVSFRENIDLSTSSGRMMAGLFSVLAEYELSIIRERTKAGMRRAKAQGKQIGRKKNYFDKRKAARLRDQGWGQVRLAKELGIGVGTLRTWLHDDYIPNEKQS